MAVGAEMKMATQIKKATPMEMDSRSLTVTVTATKTESPVLRTGTETATRTMMRKTIRSMPRKATPSLMKATQSPTRLTPIVME